MNIKTLNEVVDFYHRIYPHSVVGGMERLLAIYKRTDKIRSDENKSQRAITTDFSSSSLKGNVASSPFIDNEDMIDESIYDSDNDEDDDDYVDDSMMYQDDFSDGTSERSEKETVSINPSSNFEEDNDNESIYSIDDLRVEGTDMEVEGTDMEGNIREMISVMNDEEDEEYDEVDDDGDVDRFYNSDVDSDMNESTDISDGEGENGGDGNDEIDYAGHRPSESSSVTELCS